MAPEKALLLLLLHALLDPATAQSPPCNRYTLVYSGRAANGTLGRRFKFADPDPNPHLLLRTYVPSAADCAAACEATAACAGFTVTHHGGQLQCNTVGDVTPVGTSLVAESYLLHRADSLTTAPPPLQVWAAHAAEHVFQADTAASVRFCNRPRALDLAGAPGQAVSGQLVLRLPPGATAAERIRVVGGGVSEGGWLARVQRVGYVFCDVSALYPSERGAGWYPDPVVDLPADGTVLLQPGEALPLWVTALIPANASASVAPHREVLSLQRQGGSRVELGVGVAVFGGAAAWALAEHERSFGDAWGFNTTAVGGCAGANASVFAEFMCAHHAPPESLANSYAATRPLATIERLLAPPLPSPSPSAAVDGGACNSRLFNAAYLGSSNETSAAHVNATLAAVAPRLDELRAAGLLAQAYVYAFDESRADHEPALRALFGAVKARWPELRTLAVLPWAPSAALPLDIWVVQYGILGYGLGGTSASRFHTAAAALRARGGEVWGYHCISPHGIPPAYSRGAYLNTFVDQPPVSARLLRGWLPYVALPPGMADGNSGARAARAATGLDGWLYWYTNWNMVHDATTGQPTSSCRPLPPLDAHGRAVGYSPRTANAQVGQFTNGDGNMVYVDATGRPVASQRLVAMREGKGDLALLRELAVRNASAASALAARLLRNITDVTLDAALLETTRRSVAAALL